MAEFAMDREPPCGSGFKAEEDEVAAIPDKVVLQAVESCFNRRGKWRHYDLANVMMKCAGYTAEWGPYVRTDDGDIDAVTDQGRRRPPRLLMVWRRRAKEKGKAVLLVALGATKGFPNAIIDHGFPAGVEVTDKEIWFYTPGGPVLCDNATEYKKAIEEFKKLMPLCADRALKLVDQDDCMQLSKEDGDKTTDYGST